MGTGDGEGREDRAGTEGEEREVEEGEKAEGGRGGKGEETEGRGRGDKSLAWSSQNLGSTVGLLLSSQSPTALNDELIFSTSQLCVVLSCS